MSIYREADAEKVIILTTGDGGVTYEPDEDPFAGGVGGGADLEVEDDGVSVDVAVTKINFTGDGVEVTEPLNHEVDVTIPLPIAADVIIADAGGFFSAVEVEAALQELGAGTPLEVLPGYIHQVASNVGATHGNSTTQTTLWNGTKYDIPANSLVVGDVYLFESWGTYLNNSGAGKDLTLQYLADAVSLGIAASSLASAIVTHANTRTWHSALEFRVDSIGGTGVLNCVMRGALSDENVGFAWHPSAANSIDYTFAVFTAATVDTTQALTLDLQADHSAAHANTTITCESHSITKRNAP